MTTDWKGAIPLLQVCCLLADQLAHEGLIRASKTLPIPATKPGLGKASFKTTNKHDIISGACPTCASWRRCTGLVGCHGYPPQTFWWAPWVHWDGREGGRLSPRPLRRTDWRQTGSHSQRAPTQNLQGDERRQTPGQRAGSQYTPCSVDAGCNGTHSGSIVCPCSSWTSPSPLLAKPRTRVVFQWEARLRLHFLQRCLLSASCQPLLPWWLYRYHHIHRGRRDMYHNHYGIQCAYQLCFQYHFL